MIQPAEFIARLGDAGIEFFTGVPDSLLKGLITNIEREFGKQHFITANEGAAVALASGYFLATGKLPLVYLQNSGLGNMINPFTSLTHKEMYGIPMLLIIGWRGEPGIEDEPQHAVMGKITPSLLSLVNIPFTVLKKDDEHAWKEALTESIELAREKNRPVALLIEAGVFPEDALTPKNNYALDSATAIQAIYDKLSANDFVVCTTGKIGRVFYQINSVQKKINQYLLNIGSMGHAISLATGMALSQQKRVVLFDGDGALLMHMGALALPAQLQLANFCYILLNNAAHQSVGAQPTVGFAVDFCAVARACGYKKTKQISSTDDIGQLSATELDGCFTEIRINANTQDPLPRPAATPREAKEKFLQVAGLLSK